jgi:hypothetical protein
MFVKEMMGGAAWNSGKLCSRAHGAGVLFRLG